MRSTERLNATRTTLVVGLVAVPALVISLGCGDLADMAGGGGGNDVLADTAGSGGGGGGGGGSSSGGGGGGGGAPLEAGKVMKAKPASGLSKLINQGTKSGPPPIEPGITASQCNDLEDGGPVKGPDCVTGYIECGQTIIGHTKGGVDRYNTRFYEANFCWPGTINRNGGDERVYKFSFPDDGKWIGKVTLDTPCADLDVVAMVWDKSTCPAGNSQVAECDSQRKGGTTREYADLISDGRWKDWLIVVEGIGEDEGPFSLTVQCKEGLMWY